jgi:predicted DCC family thiol-disulfide oxidoreductase YuxK
VSATVLFDGVCALCNASVGVIKRNDPQGRFTFESLQSETGRAMLAASGRQDRTLSTLVLIDSAGLHTKSDAALRIASGLRFPWPLLGVFVLVPRPLRDAAYEWIAHNRYRWFGTK